VLKGTKAQENCDGSVSVSVARTNLNYLLRQANSIYVCFHEPTNRLLVRSAEDIYRQVEHLDGNRKSPAKVAIRFSTAFDLQFQTALHARTVAQLSTLRDDRLRWVTSEPVDFPDQVITNIPSITVPSDESEAFEVLETLYKQGHDAVISKAFGQFAASMGLDNSNLIYAYLSEINLAMRHREFDRQRVRDAILFLNGIESCRHPVLPSQWIFRVRGVGGGPAIVPSSN
jgi:hypothetical protein